MDSDMGACFGTDPARRYWLAAAVLALAALGGCRGENPVVVGRSFVEAWVVNADRARAATFSTGEALARLERDRDPLGLGGADERRRRAVSFRELSRSTTDGDHVSIEYRILARGPGGDAADIGVVRVVLHRANGGWRVSNFEVEERDSVTSVRGEEAPGA